MKKNEKFVHQLSKKFNTRNAQWVNNNTQEQDDLTFSIFSSEGQVDNLYLLANWVKFRGYNNPVNLSSDTNLNLNMSVDEFVSALKGQVEESVLEKIKDFSKQPIVDLKDKSIASVLWSNIIENKDKEYDEILTGLFFHVAQKDQNSKNYLIDDLVDEVQSVFVDKKKIDTYFNNVSLEIQDVENWYDFSSYPPSITDEEMNYDLDINSNDELIQSLKDFKNLPSALEYVKNTYLQEKNVKHEGYCQDEEIREYKALSIILKLTEKFKDDETFDEDDNIGMNLNAKLIATENLIKQLHIGYKNSEVISGFKAQSKKIVNTILDKNTTNVYGVWKNVLSAYIKKCKEIAKKVKSGEISQTTRNYLKTMGIIRDREVIKDYDRLMSELRNKVDDASKLISYLTPKALEELPADPFIDNAERIYEELKTWSTGVKNNPSKPLRLAHLNTEDLSLNLKEFATVAKRQTANKTNKDVKNQPVQMSIYDDENQNV